MLIHGPNIPGSYAILLFTVGGANLCLESNPNPARDAKRVKQILYTPGPRDPTETEIELCLSVSCGALGASDLGMA